MMDCPERVSEGSRKQFLEDSADPELIHIKDITQQKDDAEAKNYVSQVLMGALLKHFLFKFIIITVVISNCFLIAFQTYSDTAKKYHYMIIVFEAIAVAVFILEIQLKWFHGFSIFWQNGWNVLDFLLTLAVIIMNVIFSQEETKIVSILQVIRSVRVFAILPGFSTIIQAIIQSLPDMFSIFICLIVFMLAFAMIGTTLFNAAVPSAFGNLMSAMNTLFVCITQDGWADVYQEFESAEGLSYAAALYFMIFITGSAFLFANLLIAVVASNVDTTIVDSDEPMSQDKCLLKDRNIIHVDQVAAKTKMTMHQKPWTDTCLDNLTVEIIEQIALITAAIDKNEKAYVKNTEELQAVVDKVHNMCYNREKDKEVMLRNQMAASLQEDLLNNEIAMGRSGDILSTLITLEKVNVIESSVDSPHVCLRQLLMATAAHSASTTEHREETIAEIDENIGDRTVFKL